MYLERSREYKRKFLLLLRTLEGSDLRVGDVCYDTKVLGVKVWAIIVDIRAEL